MSFARNHIVINYEYEIESGMLERCCSVGVLFYARLASFGHINKIGASFYKKLVL